jgi:N-hydroxyarylamine O-acetyltransferase
VSPGNMDVAAYLRRLRYTGTIEPTLSSLRSLHRRHMEVVPFENLDIALSRPIEIDDEASVRKIVGGHRGGFCYELNGAFAALLRALEFEVTLLSARVARKNGGEGRSSITWRCAWISMTRGSPMSGSTIPSRSPCVCSRIWSNTRTWERSASARQRSPSRWSAGRRTIRGDGSQKRICSRLTPDGRITLSELNLIVTNHEHREERTLGSEQEWRAALRQYFEIVV